MAVRFVSVAIGSANCNRHFDNIDIADGRLIAAVTWPDAVLLYATLLVSMALRLAGCILTYRNLLDQSAGIPLKGTSS